ncbi:proline iminopeptidase-family hydrolase [Paenibacillus thermotolerans]|uniref:proline iminopeptidase-family hydrolase n=1 Tax=Paenibacillus thermotolerans TaxID=3027807 RepID=UPI002368AD7E|nr:MULTISPECIES: proline iminopeptidase-family hydrolase [unclassified Paenibacillus]
MDPQTNITEGYIEVPGGRVWYCKMEREPTNRNTPLLILHGGPGNSHDLLKISLGVLAADRPVIFYDQLGSGRSDKPTDPVLWRTGRFVEELECVRRALHLTELHLLGHSWGTMLAASYLLERKPPQVKSVIFSSPCLSAMRWKEDADRLIDSLPEDTRATIRRCEAEGTTGSSEYQQAMDVYYSSFVRRIPWPPKLAQPLPPSNKEVYMTMWGPSEFCPTGNLKTYDCTGRLHEIDIPALFLCGRFDEATPEATRYYQSLVPGAELRVFENSAHLSYFEEPEAYVNAVRAFLSRKEN